MPEDMDEEYPSRTFRYFIHKIATSTNLSFVMDYVTAYTLNPDSRYRKAGMMAFADELFLLFYDELRDPEVIVRRGSCIVLGCLAVNEFKETADAVLGVLLMHLERIQILFASSNSY
ncbi:hypothetical protein Glove_5g76 [Diversispora epigaea]|uniref:Uncharacterized protein n=1 Tax=Diversispora epigaea TaxID=1348612 RepID=A0A397JQH0_9GLOM|nr:hypothetical protein Glove_5g76 [Diversispora epigaea]